MRRWTPSISTEYLDTKRRPYDETYANELARHLRSKYTGYKPAAIYVTDDNALLFARDHLSRLFPGVPVFFSGVNDYGVRSSLDPALFTGVFERKEVGPNIEWLLHLDKDANDLIFIGDGSNTYQAIESELRSELIPYRLRVTFIAEKRLDRALARLHDLPGKYLFLTTLGGMTDANGQVLPLRDIIKSLTTHGTHRYQHGRCLYYGRRTGRLCDERPETGHECGAFTFGLSARETDCRSAADTQES